jgi:hypothetical protein
MVEESINVCVLSGNIHSVRINGFGVLGGGVGVGL